MGKGGEKNEAAVKKEVLIEGRMYDVTNMKHPGGSVIDFYAGKDIDATQAFESFHVQSKKAKKYLDNLPSRPADAKQVEKNLLPGQAALLADFDKLHREFEAEGLFKPDLGHVIYRFSEIILLYLIGGYLVLHNNIALGVVFMAVGQGRCGWLMHEGGHYSLTGNIKIDTFLQELTYGLGCGMSGGWWRSQHNKHHSMPQKLGYDVDLNTLPLVAFTEKVCKRVGVPLKYWIKMQAVMFPLISTLLVALGWQFYLHPRHIIRRKNVNEAFWLVMRYVLWTALFTTKFGLANSILLYLAYVWVGANYIFLHFAVSHTHLPTVPKEDTQVDWVRYAAIYTMNVKPGPFKIVNWLMGYLNFQIEHHLFPCMPQFRHPKISPRVKAFLEKHGLKYDQRDYLDAFAVTFSNLHKVGNDVFLG
eukprot:gene7596-5459_t